MVCHIKEEENAERIYLINMRFFKSTAGNLTKQLRI